MADMRPKQAQRLLHQAGRLRRELQAALTTGDFSNNDLHMKTYNDLIAAAAQMFHDDPILNGQLIKMPDLNIQMYTSLYTLLKFENMPPKLPTVRTEEHLSRLINRLELVLEEDIDEPGASQAFWSMLHPNIVQIARRKFEDGHFADAVESAFKAVNKRVKVYVKAQTARELDGADLMNVAFSPKRPIIVLDDLNSDTGRNIQVGYMQIFAGAMTGIRNPKAHDNIVINESQAIHRLFLASLLMSKLDEANVP